MTDRYLIDFYTHYDEDSRLCTRHGSVEFLTTMRYIRRYLPAGGRVLEIGAGTAPYLFILPIACAKWNKLSQHNGPRHR